MARVWSYVRFSTKKQLEGDSLRRQVSYGERWIKKNNHTLVDVELHDLGKSGYHARHLTSSTGKLGSFLRMVESGRVQKGDILLVEHLDRLSRQRMTDAEDLFKSILKSGVRIAVLQPSERVYDVTTLDTPMGLMEPLLVFYGAHLASRDKAFRLRAVQEAKRQRAVEEGVIFGRRCPSWLSFDKGKFVPNAGAEAIRYIFEATASGIGQRKLLTMLAVKFKPIGTSGKWNTSFIQKVLGDRAVLGALQPKTLSEGKRVPIGPELKNYYPAVVSEELFARAQAAKTIRLKKRGPNKHFVNLLTGIVFNAVDGHPCHIQKTSTPFLQRRLVSYGHLTKTSGSHGLTVDYYEVEKYLLRHLTELNPDDLRSNLGVSELRAKEQELSATDQRLARLAEDLANADEDEHEVLLNAARIARKKRTELREIVERMRAEVSSDQPLIQAQGILTTLAKAEGEELHTLRLNLRLLIAELVETVLLKLEKHLGRIWCLVQVNYRQGLVRQFGFGPGWEPIKSGKTDDPKDFLFTFDLRNREACQRDYLAELVALIHAPAERPVFDKIPSKLAEAGELFLRVKKSELAGESFKTIPSKIRRFCQFVGEGAKTRDLNQRDLDTYKRDLLLKVKEGKAKKSQARVEMNRAKEFIRWLQEHGAGKGIETSESGADAIP